LTERERREQQADRDRRRSKMLDEKRHQRDEDAESQDIDERYPENRQEPNDHPVVLRERPTMSC
jgi:hypothetical protein